MLDIESSMIKPLIWMTLVSSVLWIAACSNSEPATSKVNMAAYQVENAAALQQGFNQLNTKLATDFKHFKQVESQAFSNQSALDVNDLSTLDLHLVASTALKPTKVAYCNLMNGYFAEMYRLGHANLSLLKSVQLPHTEQENLVQDFASVDQFYDFILNRYSSYRQVQQVMGYGCNLKAALL